MKSFFLFFIACTITVYVTNAQGLGKIDYGIKGGFSYNLSAYTASATDATYGGYAGVMMKVPFDNRLFFAPQIDVNYRSMKANSLPANEFSKVSELQIRVMPAVQIDFKHPDKKENTLFITTGPSLGFGMGGDQVKQDQAGTPSETELKYGFQRYGRFDASWHLGFGYETRGGLRLLADYAHGLSNMINTEFGANLRYRSISAGIGYWFGRKK